MRIAMASAHGLQPGTAPLVVDSPSGEALTKLFYLALHNINQKWAMRIGDGRLR